MQIETGQNKRNLVSRMTNYLADYNYVLQELPTVEAAELFLLKAGDRIFQSLFTFESNGQIYALRPEFTAQAIHQFAKLQPPQPIARWQFEGSVFYRNPQGFITEQHELGLELIGLPGSSIDGEVISRAVLVLKQCEFNNPHIKIGNVALLRRIIRHKIHDTRIEQMILSNIAVIKDAQQGGKYILDLYDQISLGADRNRLLRAEQLAVPPGDTMSIGSRTSAEIVARIESKTRRAEQRPYLQELLEIIGVLVGMEGPPTPTFQEIRSLLKTTSIGEHVYVLIQEWEDTITHLREFDIDIEKAVRVAPALARAWDYYTGIVFDIYDSQSLTHLGGGGRYDDLARLMGASTDVPAIGFTLYIDELVALLSKPVTA
jgi:histidyl-tRNA synthetase